MNTSLAEIQRTGGAVAQAADQVIDMFSLRGFELAQRIAKAFATSDAVPAQFRLQVEKKGRNGSTWVDNPAALGNCLVAIETARAVGMSITSVMQHANVIEGRLSWSAQFQIAAINASGRFTPLRFQMRNLGRMKAKYREKQGWNDAKRGFDFIDREVEIENIECIAWAYIRENGRTTEERVESAPVSMQMAVEEGWYSKPGSKWQTTMRTLMLQYRAGAFFARIHAPDVVMGMGRSTEELQDMTTIDVAPDGTVRSVTTEELRRDPAAAPMKVVEQVGEPRTAADDADGETGETTRPPAGTGALNAKQKQEAPALDAEAFADKLAACKDVDALDLLADEIRGVADADTAQSLSDVYQRRRAELLDAAGQQQAASTGQAGASSSASTTAAAPASRRRTAPPAGTQSTIE
ncbi:hypothetical protein [Aquincola tertiaricarbonis]|uniref:hypothetical protein n=1 Tax=Aquincola tertiaricarbonis TaxID=391953 RepID=UPI000614A2B5|nr:hypothetical protein [Aquincola tertiaricarbonis]